MTYRNLTLILGLAVALDLVFDPSIFDKIQRSFRAKNVLSLLGPGPVARRSITRGISSEETYVPKKNYLVEMIQSDYGKALLLAIDIAEKGIQHVPEDWLSQYSEVLAALKNAEYLVPENGSAYQWCDENGYGAFVLGGPPNNIIYLCYPINAKNGKLDQLYIHDEYLAQVFLHEATHLAGYPDECLADIISAGFMNLGSKKEKAYFIPSKDRGSTRSDTCHELESFQFSSSSKYQEI